MKLILKCDTGTALRSPRNISRQASPLMNIAVDNLGYGYYQDSDSKWYPFINTALRDGVKIRQTGLNKYVYTNGYTGSPTMPAGTTLYEPGSNDLYIEGDIKTNSALYFPKSAYDWDEKIDYNTLPLNEWTAQERIDNSDIFRNRTAEEYKARTGLSAHKSTAGDFDVANAITAGGFNNFSPTLWAGRFIDLAQGDFEGFSNGWVNGNSGIVSDNFELNHPLGSFLINGAFDATTLNPSGALKLVGNTAKTATTVGNLTGKAALTTALYATRPDGLYRLGKIGIDLTKKQGFKPSMFLALFNPRLAVDLGWRGKGTMAARAKGLYPLTLGELKTTLSKLRPVAENAAEDSSLRMRQVWGEPNNFGLDAAPIKFEMRSPDYVGSSDGSAINLVLRDNPFSNLLNPYLVSKKGVNKSGINLLIGHEGTHDFYFGIDELLRPVSEASVYEHPVNPLWEGKGDASNQLLSLRPELLKISLLWRDIIKNLKWEDSSWEASLEELIADKNGYLQAQGYPALYNLLNSIQKRNLFNFLNSNYFNSSVNSKTLDDFLSILGNNRYKQGGKLLSKKSFKSK